MARRGTQSSKWDGLPIDEGLSYIALSVADMDIECSPAIRDAVARRAAEGLFGYTDLPPDHVDLPVEWLGRRHGWSVPREHIVAAHRIVQVVALILGAHTRPGDGIVLFTPSYSPLENAIGLNQREAVRVPLIQTPHGYELDRDATDAALAQAAGLLLVNPHNPVGKVWGEEDLLWLADRAEAHDVIVMSDDVHADFTHPGQRHRFLLDVAPSVSGRTFTFTSPAKTFNIPGLETTHVIVPDGVLRECLETGLRAAGFHNPSFFSDAATRAAYRESDDWLAEVEAIVAVNLETLRRTVDRFDGVRLVEPQGTFLAWVDARGAGSEEDLKRFITDEAHVVPSYGTDFGSEYGGYLRFNLACPHSQFEEAMNRLLSRV
jgi:cystathionine beta-lyase